MTKQTTIVVTGGLRVNGHLLSYDIIILLSNIYYIKLKMLSTGYVCATAVMIFINSGINNVTRQ